MADERALLDKFCVWMATSEGLSDATVRKYRGHLDRLIAYCTERGLHLLRVTLEDLEAYSGIYMHEIGITPRSQCVVVASTRKFYRWLVRNHVIAADPAAHLKYPRTGRPLGIMMELAWMQKLLMAPGISTFKGLRDTTLLTILAGCGPRPSGVVALNQSDVIFSVEDNVEKLYLRFTEKGKKQRIVPAPDECRALLRAYLGHPYLQKVDRSLPDGDQVLFIKIQDTGVPAHQFFGESRRLGQRGLNKMMEKYGHEIGLPADQRNPKALRHLFGTELKEDDVDIRDSMALMGHEDEGSQKMYTHLARRKLRKIIDRSNPLAKVRIPIITDLGKIQ